MSKAWLKNAVFYGIDIGAFQDSNGDGIGDFQGLIQRLPYLADLGVTCLWLLPFYSSPFRDNGYDVNDYYKVHPAF
ncbi:MAG TPA: alpha-amylase family glycosyl hydrolase, partial [Terriglobales bacterium]|nr:alpha-amylase family glycosyl hydrolase [Terriglobales bacterium]